MRRILALARKEIQSVWQDKKSRAMLIVPPLLQLFIFAFAATLDVNNVHLAVYNEDAGRWGEELISRFRGSPTFTKISRLDGVPDIRPTLDEQKAAVVVYIPKLFSQNIVDGHPVNVQLLLDGRRSNTTQIVQGYIARILEHFSQEMDLWYGRAPERSFIVPRNWFNPNLIYIWFTVTGLVVILTTIISVGITSLSVARERETGTFEQLLVSPLTPFEILVGKALPALLIGMVEGTLILLAGVTVFGIPFEGSLPLFYLAMLIFIASVVGVGLFVSSLCQTQQQAILGVFVFMAPAVILSGYATPIDNLPQWMQQLTYLNPLRYFIFIVRGIAMKGLPLSSILFNMIPMALIACFTLSAAAYLFKKKIA